jgi:hypothetical protein
MSEAPHSAHLARKRQAPDSPPDSPPDSHAKSANTPPANVVVLSFPHGLLDHGVRGFTCNISHQVNATSKKPGGLAKALVEAFPFASLSLDEREDTGPQDSLLGTVRIDKDPERATKVTVFSIYGQRYGGKPGKPNDSSADREKYFARALAHLAAQAPDLASIAFPENIGCGIASGDWAHYQAMIHDFADAMPGCTVYIVRCEKMQDLAK